MTGFTSKRQAALDKLFEVENELGLHYDQRPPMTKDEALKLALEALEKSTRYFNIVRLGESRLKDTEIRGASHAAMTAIKKALAQPPELLNFCPRCGKRTPDPTTIHTCTPPRGLEMT